MKKYAIDLTNGTRFVPKHETRIVEIEWIEETEAELLEVTGFFIDDGQPYDRTLDKDSVVDVR